LAPLVVVVGLFHPAPLDFPPDSAAGWTLFAHLWQHQRTCAALDPLCHRALCGGICVPVAAAAALSGGDWA